MCIRERTHLGHSVERQKGGRKEEQEEEREGRKERLIQNQK